MVTVAALLSTKPLSALYVKESDPTNPPSGMKVNPPSSDRVKEPPDGPATNLAVSGAPPELLSLPSTPLAAGTIRVSFFVIE